MVERPDLDAQDLKEPGRERKYADEALLSPLAHRRLTHAQWWAAVQEAVPGISRGTFSQRLREYKAEGKVLKSAADEKYSLITPKPGHSN